MEHVRSEETQCNSAQHDDTETTAGVDLETITAAERRMAVSHLLEHDRSLGLTETLLSAIARDAIGPRGEAYKGEGDDLCSFLVEVRKACLVELEAETICRMAEAIWLGNSDGTKAARLQLLRGISAFVLHVHADWAAVSLREDAKEAEKPARWEGAGA
jgi:hypothetical protein